jgi:hypothetical protein
MTDEDEYLRVRCPRCAWSALYDQRDMVQRLRLAKMLRREGQPDPDLVLELFRSAGERLACDRCGAAGLIVETPDQDEVGWNDDDGCQGRRCEVCGQPIPAERLELFPNAQRCATCQARNEGGEADEVPEYCPKCGAIMTLRTTSGGGLTRYQLRCQSCGR